MGRVALAVSLMVLLSIMSGLAVSALEVAYGLPSWAVVPLCFACAAVVIVVVIRTVLR